MGPNVLLVVLDSARADALEPYGAPAGSTPAIARLARSGVAVRDVFATASWTVPSHGSIFTGMLPRAAGLHGTPGMNPRDVGAALDRLPDRLLPEVLGAAGYRTRAVSANLWVSEQSGFARGFDEFVQIDSGRQAKIDAGDLRSRLSWVVEAARGRVDDGAAEAGQVVDRWIAEPGSGRPFFLFANLVECHSPYLPPRPYGGLGSTTRAWAAIEARRHLNFATILRTCAGGEPIAPGALKRMRRLYTGAIRYLDEWLKHVLGSLERSGRLAETTVIVTSDHGENLGEGGLITHALSLDDRLIRVPLVVAGPGAERLAEIRSLGELPRFIAELAGIESHPWPADNLPEGAAVAQLDPPVEAGDPRAAAAAAEWDLDADAIARLTEPQTCATEGRWKLLRRSGEEVLFDLARDPLELSPRPVAEADGGTEAAPIELLREALEHPAALAVAERVPATGGDRAESDPAERRSLEDRMRLLGYL